MNGAVFIDVRPAARRKRPDRPEGIGDLVSFLESDAPGKQMLGVG